MLSDNAFCDNNFVDVVVALLEKGVLTGKSRMFCIILSKQALFAALCAFRPPHNNYDLHGWLGAECQVTKTSSIAELQSH